jgi:phage tail protein X
MRIGTTLGTEKKVTDLAGRLYTAPDAPTAKAVADALVAANPFLDTIGKLPAGTVVLMPEVKGAQPTADTVLLSDMATQLLASTANEALDELERAVAAGTDANLTLAKAALDAAQSAAVQAEANADPAAKQWLDALTAQAKDAQAIAAGLQSTHSALFDTIRRDLDALRAAQVGS